MRFLLTIFFLASALLLNAQVQKLSVQKDSVATDTVPHHHLAPPQKAAIFSGILPGAGQVYNHYWLHAKHTLWKVPVIYAGFGGLIYGFTWNNSIYRDYRNALRIRYDGDPSTIDAYPQYSDDNLVTLKNYYQRYRDLCVIGMAALYTLQILDAVVDAHLSTFDVSDNLSLNIHPDFYRTSRGPVTTIGLTFTFH